MACLSQQQLVQAALAPEDKAGASAHLNDCPACRARVAAMRGLVGQLTEAHRDTFDKEHEKARAALMTVLPASDEQIEFAKPWSRIIPSTGGLTMRQRTVFGSIGAAAALALLVFWLGNAPSRVSAMERMADNIRRAKSYKVTWDFERQLVRELGKLPVTAHAKSTVFWLAPGSFRLENKGDETWAGQEDTQIYPAGKPGIDIDVKKKTFHSVAGRRGRMSSIILLDELGKYSGQADQTLGTKEINDKQARGFEIDFKKIDPDGYPGKVQMWIDTESELLVELRYEFVEGGMPAKITMRDFHWNVPLDPKLFDPTPPEGYTDITKPPQSLTDRVRIITEGLKIYAEFSGGHYPRGTMIYGDVTRDEIFKMIGIKGQPTPEQNRSDQYVKALRANLAATHLNEILRDNSDAAYHGKTVEPNDADKVLVRWKLEDDQYQVIYGDLRSESVTAERLREVEGKK
jgi:outer membrane lipoprotein-sorting protein